MGNMNRFDRGLVGVSGVGLLVGVFLACGPNGPTPQQVTSGVFTGEELLCISASVLSGVTVGNTQEVAQQVAQDCNIAAPLISEIEKLLPGLLAQKEKFARAHMLKKNDGG